MHTIVPSLMPICRPSGRTSLAVTCVNVRVVRRYWNAIQDTYNDAARNDEIEVHRCSDAKLVSYQRDLLRHFAVVFLSFPRQSMIEMFLMYSQNPAETGLSHKMRATTCRLNHDLLDWVSGNDRASSSLILRYGGEHRPRRPACTPKRPTSPSSSALITR